MINIFVAFESDTLVPMFNGRPFIQCVHLTRLKALPLLYFGYIAFS